MPIITPSRTATHGSVLVFAVIIIAVLSMLGATLILVVGQSTKLSSNIVGKVENDFAAKSGLDHATRMLRDSVTTHMIYTDTGVFSYNPGSTHPWLRLNTPKTPVAVPDLYNPLESAAPYVSPLCQFQDDPVATVTAALPLSDNTNLAFTSSPLYTTENPDNFALFNELQGTTTDFFKHTDNFHNTKLNAKVFQRPVPTRGNYYVWISDLDSKLYAHPRDEESPTNIFIQKHGWDLDNFRTGLILPPTPPALPPPTIDEILEGILKFNEGGFQLLPELESLAANDGGPSTLREQILTDIWNMEVPALTGSDYRMRHFSSLDEVATQLPGIHFLPTPSPPPEELMKPSNLKPEYPVARAELGVYFTPYRDSSNQNSPISQKFIKDHPTAININTASISVIAAALSQIPGQNQPDFLTGDPSDHSPMSPARCIALARRIVSKRPFLCRMDFEDFLAAHLWGECEVLSGIFGDIVYPLNSPPNILTHPTEDEFAYDSTFTGNFPLVRLVYYSMNRRIGRGYTPLSAPTVTTNPDKNPYRSLDSSRYGTVAELSLSQFLEIPGIPDPETTTALDHLKLSVSTTEWYWPNEPYYQKKRFEFFVRDDQGADLSVTRDMAQITPFEFNNIINSVTSVFPNDDVQNVAVGKPAPISVITAGSDNKLQTSPQGDDVLGKRIFPGTDGLLNTVRLGDDVIDGGTIVPGLNGIFDSVLTGDDEELVTEILPGKNGLADTWISAFRPSYYSFIDDSLFLENFWSNTPESIDESIDRQFILTPAAIASATHILDPNIRVISTTGSETIELADTRASQNVKMYYRLPLNPAPMTAPNLADASIEHLVTWRCLPGGLSPRRSGFYQMSFDNWQALAGSGLSFSYGPMQPMGDFVYSDGVDDPSNDDLVYSSARPWSGQIPTDPNIQASLAFDFDHQNGVDPAEAAISVGNGDVSWGPKFAFRSRFFGVYVLGRGELAGPLPDPNDSSAKANDQRNAVLDPARLKSQGEKRIEAVYDALLDQIIWQRSPITDKRALGEPVP